MHELADLMLVLFLHSVHQLPVLLNFLLFLCQDCLNLGNLGTNRLVLSLQAIARRAASVDLLIFKDFYFLLQFLYPLPHLNYGPLIFLIHPSS